MSKLFFAYNIFPGNSVNLVIASGHYSKAPIYLIAATGDRDIPANTSFFTGTFSGHPSSPLYTYVFTIYASFI